MTTSPPKPANDTHADDPLEQLEAQIRRGTLTGPVRRRNGRPTSGDAPLDWLEARLAEASDPATWAEVLLDSIRHSEGPLAELDTWIQRARQIERAVEGYPEELDASSEDPLERLRTAVRREIEEIGGRSAVSARETTGATRDSARPAQSATNAEAAVGREVLKLLERRDLSGAARSEATRLLATAIDDPDADTLRRVLEILITGESPD